MEPRFVERNIWIAAPRERVWQVVTEPKQVAQWLVPNIPGVLMERDGSGKIIVHMNGMGLDFATLEAIEPLRQAVMRGLPDQWIAATYMLEDENGGTRVSIKMTGFESLPTDAREDRLEQSGAGWAKALENLKAYVGGTALPHPQAYVGPLLGYWRETRKMVAIERSIWIAATCERAWRAITDPKQIQQWFSPTTAWEMSALEPGGKLYVLDAETNTEMYVQMIERVEPPHQFVTRSVPEPSETVVYRTIYTLEDENGGTRLAITHTGYEQVPDDTRWVSMEQNTFGFGMMLQNTKAYVEGEVLPFPQGF